MSRSTLPDVYGGDYVYMLIARLVSQATGNMALSLPRIQIILKGHRFVESALRLLLQNKLKKFEDYAIAKYYCS